MTPKDEISQKNLSFAFSFLSEFLPQISGEQKVFHLNLNAFQHVNCLPGKATNLYYYFFTHLVTLSPFGIAGFEPVTSITPRWRATKLRHAPL